MFYMSSSISAKYMAFPSNFVLASDFLLLSHSSLGVLMDAQKHYRRQASIKFDILKGCRIVRKTEMRSTSKICGLTHSTLFISTLPYQQQKEE